MSNEVYEPYIGHKWVSCTTKKAFDTLEEVKAHCAVCKLYFYKCRYCGRYHTTKYPTYESVMS